jgi:histidine kinase
MIMSWAFSIFIPIALILGINVITYGPNSFSFLTNPDYFNKEIYQLEELNDGEYLSKMAENLFITRPTTHEVEQLLNDMQTVAKHSEFKGPHKESFLILRKNQDVLNVMPFGDDLPEKEKAKFENLPKDILPPFQPGKKTNNEILFHQTGFVIAQQMDFYFNDGAEGSLFYFTKYTNIPGKIAAIIGRNLLFLVMIMFAFHSFLAFIMSRRITDPVKEIVIATEEIMDGNYKYQIPLSRQPLLRNVSNSINKMIDELDRGKNYQDKIETMRAEFIANLSHDIKTPLTSIKIHAQAIKDGIVTTPEKMDKYIDNILKKSDDMDAMLEELKVFNDLELGTGNYAMERINFEYFLIDAVDELRYDVDAKNINLTIDTRVHAPMMEFDPKKIKRVLNNITFNAIKYGEVRPLNIHFKLEEVQHEHKRCLKLCISDNGIGVRDHQLGKLFDQYYRVDPARNQTISGSGLGLSIAKSIIEHHGGCISAKQSELGGLAIVIYLNCEVE